MQSFLPQKYLRRSLCVVLTGLAGLAFNASAKEWPAPVKALEAQGLEIVGSFDAPGGLTGYAGILQQQPIAVYVTSDGKQAIIGSMVDAKGADLTREPMTRLVSKPMSVKTLKLLEQSAWIAEGAKTAPRVVYTFTDPNCPYCNKFWNDAQPWIKAGKVQVRHVIVGILGPTSPGKAAALLSAPDPQAALLLHEQQHRSGGIKPLAQVPATIRAQLEANQELMQQLGFSATPATVYKDAEGNLQTVMGAPSAEKLKQVLGPL
jgi:thiol:disulfide interchange protein DsbG